MKLTVTTADPKGRRADHLLDVPDEATVGDLSAVFDARPLYLGAEALRDETPLSAAGVRAGALLGLGAPAPEEGVCVWRPPPGEPELIEVRHVSGPGSGRVWRFGPGSHEVGTDRGCVIRLDPLDDDAPVPTPDEDDDAADLPARGIWITVSPDGSVSVRLPEGVDPERCGLRSLTPPPPVDPDTGTPLTDEEPAGREDGGPGGHSTEPTPPGPDGLPQEPEPLPPGELPPLVDEVEEWPGYADLAVGDHLLRLAAPFAPQAAVKESSDGLTVEFSRPPRITPHLDGEKLSLPGPPSPSGARPFPFVLMISPLVMGLGMMAIFRSFYFIILIFFTPLIAVANWLSGRRNNRKRHEEAMRRYRLRRAALEREMRRATVEERALRNAASPDPAAAHLIAAGPAHQLWERRRHHEDYLALRIGTVTRASLKQIADSARDSNHRSVHWRLADVPIAVEMPKQGVVGLTGAPGAARAVARWMVAQSAVLHSPRDLRVVILTDEEHAEDWAWTRWLPHLRPHRPSRNGPPLIAIGNDPRSVSRRVNELIADIQIREKAARDARHSGDITAGPDVLLIVDGAWRLRDVPGVVQLLSHGPPMRMYSLCLDEHEHTLPEECTAVITAHGNQLTLRSSNVRAIEGIRADQVAPAWCEQVARALAPVRDVTVEADSGLPTDVRLLPLLGQEPPDPAALLRGWQRRPASTSFVIGGGYDGPTRLDLVADGPHGLIGGTTGSGKSELLQTMIASLAAENRPDELTFVLVDYKGGSAFSECARLPHTLGMITDLDGHLVARALASLAAELQRREKVLAEVGVKDHRAYRAKRNRDPSLAPLPRLLLVIDEFATLVRELVEFVPGLISLAQRGRSLGLHLVLATQRPAGSVSNEIRANTNLRIALRVTDRSESQDVINSPEAALISPATPGRALVRRGGGAPMSFQTAWAGAERPGEDPGGLATAPVPVQRPVRRAAVTWEQLGHPVAPTTPDADEELEEADGSAPEGEGGPDGEDPPTDLSTLVAALRAAADALTDFTPQPSPWLPPLPRRLLLREPKQDPVAGLRLASVPYAFHDLPHQQRQRMASIDFSRFGHLYVVGAPRSGRTQTLRTIAGSIAMHLTADQLHLYGIDAGGGGLAAMEALPHCGAVVTRQDMERLERLIRRLVAELTRRQTLIARHDAGSLTELRAALPATERPPHLLLLIDGWDALYGILEKHDSGRLIEELFRLLREGASAGLHLIATSEHQLLGSRSGQHNDQRLLLRQTERTDYSLVGIDRKSVPSHVPPGRGWQAPGGIESQILLLPTAGGPDEDEEGPAQGRAPRAPVDRLAKEPPPAENAPTAPDAEPAAEQNADADRPEGGAAQDAADSRGASRTGEGRRREGPRNTEGDQADALRSIGLRTSIRDGGIPQERRAFPVHPLPSVVGFQEAMDQVPEDSRRPLWAMLGVSGDDAVPIGHDFAADSPTFVVVGPPRSGRSTTLAAMCVSLLVNGTALVVLTPRDSPLRQLGAHGLATVIDDPDPSAEALREAVAGAAGREVMVVVDDADLLANGRVDKELRKIASTGRERSCGLLLAGPAEGMTTIGWIGIVRRARRGLLLSARNLGDGELIGVRISVEQLRPPAAPGRAVTTGPGGKPIAVQVPLTVLQE